MKKEEVGIKVVDLLTQATGESLDGVINAIVDAKVEEKLKEKLNGVQMGAVEHIVKVGNYEPKKLKGYTSEAFDDAISWIAYTPKKNIAFVGDAGTGKGYVSRQIAEALDGEFYEVNAVQDKYDLTGFVDANSYYVETPWYRACKSASDGNAVVFLFDEVDCSIPEVLKIFNEGVASREFTFPNGETLEFPNLIIICASNTAGTGADLKYVANKLDDSTLNRYVYIEVDFDERIELAVAGGDKELVEFIHEVRKVGRTMGFVPSYRDIERIASMRGSGMDLRKILKQAMYKAMDADSRDLINNALKNVIPNNIFYKASKGEYVEYEEKTSSKASA